MSVFEYDQWHPLNSQPPLQVHHVIWLSHDSIAQWQPCSSFFLIPYFAHDPCISFLTLILMAQLEATLIFLVLWHMLSFPCPSKQKNEILYAGLSDPLILS